MSTSIKTVNVKHRQTEYWLITSMIMFTKNCEYRLNIDSDVIICPLLFNICFNLFRVAQLLHCTPYKKCLTNYIIHHKQVLQQQTQNWKKYDVIDWIDKRTMAYLSNFLVRSLPLLCQTSPFPRIDLSPPPSWRWQIAQSKGPLLGVFNGVSSPLIPDPRHSTKNKIKFSRYALQQKNFTDLLSVMSFTWQQQPNTFMVVFSQKEDEGFRTWNCFHRNVISIKGLVVQVVSQNSTRIHTL